MCASNGKGIYNLKRDGIVSLDTLVININNTTYTLTTRYASIAQPNKFLLGKRTEVFKDETEELMATVTLYFPQDSALFNNSDYLSKFRIRDSDIPDDIVSDSVTFSNQCPFGFHFQLINEFGDILKSENENDLLFHFYEIDSIKYIERQAFDYAQYKVFSHFKATLTNGNNGEKQKITGRLVIQFETNK